MWLILKANWKQGIIKGVLTVKAQKKNTSESRARYLSVIHDNGSKDHRHAKY